MSEVLQVLTLLKGIVGVYDAPILVFLRLDAPVSAVDLQHALACGLLNLNREAVVLNGLLLGGGVFGCIVVVEVLLVLGEGHLLLRILILFLLALILDYLSEQAQVL